MNYALVEVAKNIKNVVESNLGGIGVKHKRI